jgi:hypothetical protein
MCKGTGKIEKVRGHGFHGKPRRFEPPSRGAKGPDESKWETGWKEAIAEDSEDTQDLTINNPVVINNANTNAKTCNTSCDTRGDGNSDVDIFKLVKSLLVLLLKLLGIGFQNKDQVGNNSCMVIPANSNTGNIRDINGNMGDISTPISGNNIGNIGYVAPAAQGMATAPGMALPTVGAAPVSTTQSAEAAPLVAAPTADATTVAQAPPVEAAPTIMVVPMDIIIPINSNIGHIGDINDNMGTITPSVHGNNIGYMGDMDVGIPEAYAPGIVATPEVADMDVAPAVC